MIRLTRLTAAVALLAAIGCGDCHNGQSHKTQKATPADTVILKPELLQPLLLAAKPEKTLSVPEVTAKPADEKVIVSGVSPPEGVRPFNSALATFVILSPEDAARPEVQTEFSCPEAATCPRCRKVLEKYAVRVELVDAQGQVLPTTVEGFSGIKPGSPLTIEGVVKREGKDKNLVRIVATRFFPG
jgi:hypothetical protein